jgi:hypothetical protein
MERHIRYAGIKEKVVCYTVLLIYRRKPSAVDITLLFLNILGYRCPVRIITSAKLNLFLLHGQIY